MLLFPALCENSMFACMIVEVNFQLSSVSVQNARNAQHKTQDGSLSWISLLLNSIHALSVELYGLITIPL